MLINHLKTLSSGHTFFSAIYGFGKLERIIQQYLLMHVWWVYVGVRMSKGIRKLFEKISLLITQMIKKWLK